MRYRFAGFECARLWDARGEIRLARRHAQAAGRLGAARAMAHVVAGSASLSAARRQPSHS
jgi:hypothetical protein